MDKRTIWARCGFTEVIWKWSLESDSWPLSLQEDNSKKVVQLEEFRAEYSGITLSHDDEGSIECLAAYISLQND